MSTKLYEMIGRKQAEIEVLNEEYNKLLGMLDAVAQGKVPIENIDVDLAQRSCRIKPETSDGSSA